MNSCSIRDLLRLALPYGTRLLTPLQGLHQQVNHAVSLRPVMPALPPLRGGELVVLSVSEALVLDEHLTLRNLVTRLKELRVGAIAYIGAVDLAATEVGAALGVPLLLLPAGVTPRAVERDALYLLNNRELQLERRAAQLYQRLTQQVASDVGFAALLRVVHEATGRSIGFYGPRGDLRHEISAPGSNDGLANLRVESVADARLNEHPFVVKRVGKERSTFGYVALAGAALDSWDDAAANQAAAALLLELAKQQAVESVEARVGGELLQRIVSGQRVDLEMLQQQAVELDYDLNRPHAALLVASAVPTADLAGLADQLRNLLQREQIKALTMVDGAAILCLVPTDEELDRPKQLVQRLTAEVPVTAGISEPAATAVEWPRAYQEAEQTLRLGQYLFGPDAIAVSRDLRVYQLLFQLRSSPELWSFHEALLRPMLDHDQAHRSALCESLEAYFAAQGNVNQASDRLNVHRNTLLYRLRRVSEICGVDVRRSEDMLALQVALKAHHILAAAKRRVLAPDKAI